jgi:murein DD-endopeptidase MepM/ murein hydrolase activator NlpD
MARTIPKRGAVSKPRHFELVTPFPCGTRVRVNCAYGPSCSPAHRRTSSTTSTNDYYAVDFTRLEGNNGFNEPIVAVASGTVKISGWARGGWAPYGKMVYIDHGSQDRSGERYQSLYAHLHKVLVQKGQTVEAGTVIGMMGGSSRGNLGRFGPHLHFVLYRGAKSTLGGGVSVVPEPMGKFEELHTGMHYLSCGSPDRDILAVAPGDEAKVSRAFGGLMWDLRAGQQLH